MRPDDEIDALIDDVARSMTDAQRPSVLWRGVQPRPTASLAWAAAAIAVLASAIVFMTREPRDVETPVVSVAPAPVVEPAPAPRAANPPVVATVRAPRLARAESPVEPLGGLGEGPVRVEPVVLDAVAPMPLELEEIETPMPLRAEWIEIEPLDFQ